MEKVNLTQFEDAVTAVEQSVHARAERRAEKLAKEIEEKAQLRAKNIKRQAEGQTAARRKARLKAKYEEQKEIHNQFGLAIEEALRQFSQELQGLSFVAVGTLHDRDSVERRRQQLNILKETMSTITMLMKMQESLEEKYNLKKDDAREGRGDNVVLFKHAEKLLKKAEAKG